MDQLKLESFRFSSFGPIVDRVSKEDMEQVQKDIHGTFHFIVARWLQEQGANLIR